MLKKYKKKVKTFTEDVSSLLQDTYNRQIYITSKSFENLEDV